VGGLSSNQKQFSSSAAKLNKFKLDTENVVTCWKFCFYVLEISGE